MKKLGNILMDITLHIGAHRCATTSFQHFTRDQHERLRAHKACFWGPRRTRDGLFSGLFPGLSGGARAKSDHQKIRRAEGRVQMQLAQSQKNNLSRLLISDENLIGSVCHCLRSCQLYPAIGERMARLSSAIEQPVGRVVFAIRAQDLWWASAAAFNVARGHGVVDAQARKKIAQSPRSWRDVITDIACAMPDAEILIAPFEQFAGRPHRLFENATGIAAPASPNPIRLNQSPDMQTLRAQLASDGADPDLVPDRIGRWQPFNAAQAAQLRENYADDMHWLIAGADGLAKLIQDPTRIKTGNSLRAGALTEGNSNDIGQEKLARSG